MDDSTDFNDGESLSHPLRSFTLEEKESLNRQSARGLVPLFRQNQLELDAGKNWDKFYKRNETRFFKDRHWTTREFTELIGGSAPNYTLLEVGCGVGNFLYPLLEEKLSTLIYACDVSPRAIEFVRHHDSYDEKRLQVFVADATKDDLILKTGAAVDIVSLIFVLSAIHPNKMAVVIDNLFRCIKPGGIVLFRDYAVGDMAMVRFRPGSKLGERFYARQDGTRAYYFTTDEVSTMFTSAGFTVVFCTYVSRQTVNLKEGVDCQRLFLQGKFLRPAT